MMYTPVVWPSYQQCDRLTNTSSRIRQQSVAIRDANYQQVDTLLFFPGALALRGL